MVVHRGLLHRYLSMTINYSTRGVARILMMDYVKDIVMTWDKASDGIELDSFKIKYMKLSGEPTPAPSNLFMVDEDSAKLPEKQKAAFHNVVAKALYMAKQARPNIAVSVSFLTTRVRCPDVQDWVKLHHLVKYLRSTVNLPLTLGATSGRVLHWYVEAAFAVNPNMRGHSEGALTLGLGLSHPLASRSSTLAVQLKANW